MRTAAVCDDLSELAPLQGRIEDWRGSRPRSKGMPEGLRPRIRDLADRMQIQHHSAVELVNRLETGGYVRRERAVDDRREVMLALTPKGEKVLAELAWHHLEELQEAAPQLVAALRRVMSRKSALRNRALAATDNHRDKALGA